MVAYPANAPDSESGRIRQENPSWGALRESPGQRGDKASSPRLTGSCAPGNRHVAGRREGLPGQPPPTLRSTFALMLERALAASVSIRSSISGVTGFGRAGLVTVRV